GWDMANPRLAADLDEIHRDLDLVVFALERRPDDLETARKERARARRELDLRAWGASSQGIAVRPVPVELHTGKGFAGAVRAALSAVDGAQVRTRMLEVGRVPATDVIPSVTVEPTPFWEACRDALSDLPPTWPPATTAVRELCATGATQLAVDRGQAESNTSAWQSPELPTTTAAVLPLVFRHGQDVEGLARVGVRTLDVVVRYGRPPAIRSDGQPATAPVSPAWRTLLVPAWEPFEAPAPPDPEQLEAAIRASDAAAIRALLHPEPPGGCGCHQSAAPWRALLIALMLVRRRS
ncbi:MAG: hypothetical protein KC656_21530, partial [Myxococcales bacterium]|nr:hypothetical protein [Myxococcales bacterium]